MPNLRDLAAARVGLLSTGPRDRLVHHQDVMRLGGTSTAAREELFYAVEIGEANRGRDSGN